MRPWWLAAVISLLLLSACTEDLPEPPPSGPGRTAVVPQVEIGQYPEVTDAVSGLTMIFGTPDLGVGRNRIAFALTSEQGFVSLPVATLETHFFPSGESGPRDLVETASARFYRFPLGSRGSYVAEVNLDRAGTWGFEARVPRPDGSVGSVQFVTDVPESPMSPAVGALAPRSENRTSGEAPLAELTTSSEPDPDLYQRTVAAAVESGQPTMIVFASPAFCTTPLCGPQVELVAGLEERYRGRASFIHIDLFGNPHEIKGDLTRAMRSGIVEEWGLVTDEWTFIVGRDGRISARFESFAGEDELVPALEAALGADS